MTLRGQHYLIPAIPKHTHKHVSRDTAKFRPYYRCAGVPRTLRANMADAFVDFGIGAIAADEACVPVIDR